MPGSARSLRVTEAFRARVFGIRDRIEREIAAGFPGPRDNFDDWVPKAAATVARGQAEAQAVVAGYLAAFLTSETGEFAEPPQISAEFVGLSGDGQPLERGMRVPVRKMRRRLAAGDGMAQALTIGRMEAERLAAVDFDASHRKALLQTIHEDQRFEGWTRAVSGTCGACSAVAAGLKYGIAFPVHPHCLCLPEPHVSGVVQTVVRATGAQVFASKSKEQQDEMLGPETAEAVRSGEISLSDLADHPEVGTQPFLTQRPLEDARTQ